MGDAIGDQIFASFGFTRFRFFSRDFPFIEEVPSHSSVAVPVPVPVPVPFPNYTMSSSIPTGRWEMGIPMGIPISSTDLYL